MENNLIIDVHKNSEQYKSRDKLELLLKEIYEKKLDVEATINRFCRIFAGEYMRIAKSVNQAYYQLDEQDFYLTDGSGISFCVYSGDMDRFGGSASHSGTDIVIKSPFSLDENGNRGITLFSEGKNAFIPEEINVEALYNIDFSIDRIRTQYNIDEAALSVLPDVVKNNEEIAAKRYELLKAKAESEYSDALEYERISPYGGEDVIVVPAYDLLQVYIDDYKDDRYFYDQAMTRLLNDKDFEGKINEEYKDLTDTLYIIENIEAYKKLEILRSRRDETEQERENLLEERAALKKEMAELSIEKARLEARRYGLRSILRGERKADKQLIDDISIKASRLEKGFDEVSKKYEDAKLHNEILTYAVDELRSRLKVPCYERNPETLLKDKDYCLERVKEIDSYRKKKYEINYLNSANDVSSPEPDKKLLKCIRLAPGEPAQIVELEDDLDELQKAVGGYIEFIDLTEDVSIMVNEEGKLMFLEPCRALKSDTGEIVDILVGNCYIVANDWETGELISLKDSQLTEYLNLFYSPEIICKQNGEIRVMRVDEFFHDLIKRELNETMFYEDIDIKPEPEQPPEQPIEEELER